MKNHKKAFTLIELLVVIAIIAILAAILFPVFAQAKLAAKKTAGLAQQKQIGTALQIYTTDYDDGIPTWNTCLAAAQNGQPLPLTCSTLGTFAAEHFWDVQLSPYVKNGRPELSQWSGIWRSPGAEYPETQGRSVGMNQLIFWKIENFTSGGQCLGPSTNPFSGCYYYLNQSQVILPAQTMFVGDSGIAGRIEPLYFLNGWGEKWNKNWVNYGRKDWAQAWRYGDDGANYTWLDTHARFHKGDQIYPHPGRNFNSFAWPQPALGNIYCAAAKWQAPNHDAKDLLVTRAASNGITCQAQ
ncbi:prepilin-type N-terminal cleavage/methylation domain-containing protein [Kamptonema cortianum]|nr:prepilin-type N-terminal cleavage/methylation domain-containing protein [Geitlerinema splendidum]MDK3156028.1 prepilin-type N-terminal cleavage/methylation domain-containing protein [Kamptonema cortianum]